MYLFHVYLKFPKNDGKILNEFMYLCAYSTIQLLIYVYVYVYIYSECIYINSTFSKHALTVCTINIEYQCAKIYHNTYIRAIY